MEHSRFGTAVSRLSFVLFFVASSGAGYIISAQNVQSHPVARLVTATAYSRARHAESAKNPSEASEGPIAPAFVAANAIELRAFEKTNQARLDNGLPPLVWDTELFRMARINSEHMAQLGYFSHVTPDGMHLRDRARAVGIVRFSTLGENIAYNQGYEDPGGFAVERWMLSPGHRANILGNGFRASAIGAVIAADGSVFLTQLFITR